jgi:hypothetical protein
MVVEYIHQYGKAHRDRHQREAAQVGG